jgi:hypothetical protein
MDDLSLKTKPDAAKAMERLHAWLSHEILDRVPVQFHRQDMTHKIDKSTKDWDSMKARWFDSEYQVNKFIDSIQNREFLAESFPVFWPNLGPDVYAALYGIELEYADETSYAIHRNDPIKELIDQLELSKENPYWKKLEEMTERALEMSEDRYFVGYSDFHPGFDTVAAWRNPEAICLDILLEPEGVKQLLKKSTDDFQFVFDHFHNLLSKYNQPSVNWMEVPISGKFHVPSCDFAALISQEDFNEFYLPLLQEEVKKMDYNVFHLDGRGVAKNIDAILSIPEINAIQWVQGVGNDQPIEQWKPLIRKIQAAGKSVQVFLQPNELIDFMSDMKPEGIMLSIPSSGHDEEIAMLKRISKWTK